MMIKEDRFIHSKTPMVLGVRFSGAGSAFYSPVKAGVGEQEGSALPSRIWESVYKKFNQKKTWLSNLTYQRNPSVFLSGLKPVSKKYDKVVVTKPDPKGLALSVNPDEEVSYDPDSVGDYFTRPSKSYAELERDLGEADFTVSILIDMSYSMVSDGSILHAAKAALSVSDMLDYIGVRHEILGYKACSQIDLDIKAVRLRRKAWFWRRNYGRYSALEHYVFRSIDDEQWDSTRLNALYERTIEDAGGTVDSEALIWASKRVEGVDEKMRVIVVISDGVPATYMVNGSADGALRPQAVSTIRQIEKGDYYIVGLGVGGNKHIGNIYSNHLIINDDKDTANVLKGFISGLSRM